MGKLQSIDENGKEVWQELQEHPNGLTSEQQQRIIDGIVEDH